MRSWLSVLFTDAKSKKRNDIPIALSLYSLSNKMDNSLLAVRDINHKYIVVEKWGNQTFVGYESGANFRVCPWGLMSIRMKQWSFYGHCFLCTDFGNSLFVVFLVWTSDFAGVFSEFFFLSWLGQYGCFHTECKQNSVADMFKITVAAGVSLHIFRSAIQRFGRTVGNATATASISRISIR